MRNAECGMRNAECGMRNAECGMRPAIAIEFAIRLMDATNVPIERELDLHAFAPRDIPSVVDE